ncbi:hypothetical protein [uncultured Ruminococcus sp.]|uniref:hypothetical protein n=1 Tax=uncultured Ruminococcus sp. TaxID=165186 RepID=UPI00261581F6|nr:hypothetical protein [uncultured Ruminococcus sp.]
MKLQTSHKKKWIKRVVSFTTALVLIPSCTSMYDMADYFDFSDIMLSANAEAVYDTSKFSNMEALSLGLKDFAEYSRCYANDPDFAAAHQEDEVKLNPAGYWKLESSGDDAYVPLGTEASPFKGTIRVNALEESQSFLLLMDSPLFDIVYDSVNIYKGETTAPVPLEFIKIESNEKPLMANEVRYAETQENSTLWKVNLSDQTREETINGSKITYGNFHTYGGVIGKMNENAVLNLEFTDKSTAEQGATVKRSTAQGILCGEMTNGASLTATYINSTGRAIKVGEDVNASTGGLVGSMAGAAFTLNPGSSALNFAVNTGDKGNGLIAGSAGASSVINLPNELIVSGSVTSSGKCAGGLVGSLNSSDIIIGETGTGSVTLNGVTVSGTDKVGGVIGYYAPSTNNDNTLNNITYNLTNCTISGNNPGGIVGEYDSVGGETFDVSKFVFSGTKFNKGSAGGVFGVYNANGDTTITGEFSAPESSVEYGGVIGKYTSNGLANSLILKGLTVDSVNQTTDKKKLGGVILNVTDESYIKVDGVTVDVTGGAEKCDTSNPFGGIVSTIGSSTTSGSFLDVAGDFTLTTSAAYNGGAIAGSFKNGVLRLAGTTDISGAQTANGYGQLIYENDNTLVYAKGSGSDANWTFKRNADTTASDLGQWGEVVRLFGTSNAEDAGIVTVNETDHTVTIAEADTSISDTASFAKVALNMQLNDGENHGALCFADITDSKKQTLLSGIINVENKIELTGTGLLGLMRDGGNGKYLKHDNNTFENSPDFFSGKIKGSNNAEIVLNVGESYGVDSADSETVSATGGHIYLSKNYGHDAQGLISFGKGATIEDLTISGSMSVEKTSDTTYNHLYMAAAMGVMTNGASLNNVNITTEITSNKDVNSKYYIGGVSGVFDGKDTSEYSLSIIDSQIKPNITLTGDVASYHDFNNKNIYAGGVLGLLKGAETTKYNVTIKGTEISPIIKLGDDVGNVTDSFIGGMIGYVRKNTTNEREISLNTVTMNGAVVEQICQYSGGLLGAFWDRTQVTIDGLTITGSKVENKRTSDNNNLSGLVYRATGKWDINELNISNTDFSATNNAHINFGLIVNEAYNGNDGLYLNLKNSGYSLTDVTIPTLTKDGYYADEIAAKTASSEGNVVSGGNGTGIININMNTADGSDTKITDTGTYQNRVIKDKLIANQNARYYYNLDVIKAKETPTDGEKFLMWSIYNNYASSNIQNYGVLTNVTNNDVTSLKDIDLTGLSYYPVNAGSVTFGTAEIKLGFNEIKSWESDNTNNTDNWARYPDTTGDMNKTIDTERRNQHYLMHNGLFNNVTGTLKANGRVTFSGDFGGVGNAGMLVGNELTGNIDLTKGVTLKEVKPSVPDSPMLVNYINGTAADISPQFLLSGLRLEGYSAENTSTVASALINKAEGTNMKLIFSDIKLDARNGDTISDLNWTDAAAQAMNEAYGTSRSIFSKATLFKSLKSNSTDTIEYYYTWDEDWGKDEGETAPRRNVTYGKEVNFNPYTGFYKDEDEQEKSGERRYSGTKRTFTNPTDGSDTEFDFGNGFLPYVSINNIDATYNISEVKVNFVSSGLTEGCGTYNDPYIITSAKQLTKVAYYINSVNAVLDTIRLPNQLNATWHDAENGDSIYKKNDSTSSYDSEDGETNGITTWTYSAAREYLAGAYYVIADDMTLGSDFPGIGKGGASENGKTVFHGVIVGEKKSDGTYPTITNYSVNSFIYISNGSVVKNLNFIVDSKTGTESPITINQSSNQGNALYGYMGTTASEARYYGGVFGEIMGGDNIIDNVSVTFTDNRPILLRDGQRHLIALGGFAGAIVNGGLIFRGKNSVTGLKVYSRSNATQTTISENEKVLDIESGLGKDVYKQLYVNPYVGRVINGYAVNEGSSVLNNTDKHYTIDKITPPNEEDKLDVDYDNSKIDIPNAQALFVMSLITQSTAGTAVSQDGDYGVSQSYGINTKVFCGSNHLGDYSQVGLKNEANAIYTDKADLSDYSSNAFKDVAVALDETRKTAVPYIIYAYTKADSDGNYPARTITTTGYAKSGASVATIQSENKFWDITLKENGDFKDFGKYTSFRGIGSVGLRSKGVKDNNKGDRDKYNKYNMKVNSFDGNGNTICLSIKMTRYQREHENYFYKLNISENTKFTAKWPSSYGIDTYTESLLGLGLFDMTWTKDENSYYKNFTLTGYVKDVCYKSDGTGVTGTNAQTQLYAVGGVVGQGYYGFYQNFDNIYFDGLEIDGSYACGGLIGMNSDISGKDMRIQKCNSVGQGISVTGGYFGIDDNPRIGIGSLVGMSIGTTVHIDGADPEHNIEKSDMYISKVSTYYTGEDNRCVVGGLIGYTGQGAEIKNVNIVAMNDGSVIGADNVAIVGGILGFTQRHDTRDSSLVFENCSITNISVKARRCAGGLFGRSWYNDWGPTSLEVTNCSVIGNGTTSVISANGTTINDAYDIVGGLLGQVNTKNGNQTIDGCTVSGYTIKGCNVGGLIGHVRYQGSGDGTNGSGTVPCIIRNTVVSDCNIQGKNYYGGLVGENRIYISGYNISTNNVIFKDWEGNGKTDKAGAFVGKNFNTSRQVNLVAVAKYADRDKISKVPTSDIKTNPGSPFIVYADYTAQSLISSKNTENISSFGNDNNIDDQKKAPYLTINPSSAMGNGAYISGDGAYQLSESLAGYEDYTSGKSAAARIYADYAAETKPNRAYAVSMTSPISNITDPVSLETFFQQNAASGEFKVSTWNTEMGAREGVDDFTLLVINDANDPENTTNLIDNYIRLMTNTDTHYMADSSGKYNVEVTPCRYNSETHQFELHSEIDSGLTQVGKANALNSTDGKFYQNGYYQMNLENADSKYDDQFTLIDVQYYDPTNTNKIAYHLYVPVLTKKTVNIEFMAASISGSDYKAMDYINKIESEINAGKNANDPTILVDSMDVWTTTYIRFKYPVDQVNELLRLGSDLKWNHDKQVSIVWTRENNIPDDTKMVLIDPNQNKDKAYYSTAGHFSLVNMTRVVDFSEFTERSNGTGAQFHEQTLHELLYDKVTVQTNSDNKGAYNEVTSKTATSLTFHINGTERYFEFAGSSGSIDLVVEEPLCEDYYLSLYVPKTSGQADVVQIQPSGMLGTVSENGTEASGNVIRATVTSKLNAALIIGDFYEHNVTSFSVTSNQNSNIITEANKTLTATTVASINLIDNDAHTQAPYFATTLSDSSINLYHSFNLQMICHNTLTTQTDIIKGIEKNNITATYSINNGAEQSISGDDIIRETSYIQCTTGDIKAALINKNNNYTVTITGTAIMEFSNFSDEFPSNPSDIDGIGVQGAVRSNIAYQQNNLPYSKMYAKYDPVRPFFYTKDDNSAQFSFDVLDELDEEDIGTNTKNNSRLGVNDYFTYNNVIHGKSVYNAIDIKDYTNSTSIEYTLELFRKTTTNGETEYKQVNISDYIIDVKLLDSDIPSEENNLTERVEEVTWTDADGNDVSVNRYVYTRDLDLDGIDKDAVFFTDFTCNVLKDEAFTKKEYANYKIQLTVHLNGSSNNERTSYIIYTNAKIDPSMIEEVS